MRFAPWLLVRAHVLGSGAGANIPQWTCTCSNCRDARLQAHLPRPRTGASLAISVDGERWVLVNPTPDVREQLQRFQPLHPRGEGHVPLHAVVLTQAEPEQCIG